MVYLMTEFNFRAIYLINFSLENCKTLLCPPIIYKILALGKILT